MRKCKLFVRKRLTAGVLAVAMAFAIAPGYNAKEARADQTIEEIQREKEKTEEKKKEAQSKLDDLNVKKDDIVEVIQELDNQIAEYEAKIEELTQQRNAIQAGVSITEDKLQNAYIAEANQYRNMKERIQYAYENGDTAYIDALMSVGNYDDIINQSEYVGQVSAYDQKELQKLAEIEASIAQYEEELGTKLDNVNELKSEAEGEQAEDHDVEGLGRQEGGTGHRCADGDAEEDRDDVHQGVLNGVGQALGDAALPPEVAQHQAADQRRGGGQEQDAEDRDHDGEDDLLGLGDRSGLGHDDGAFLFGRHQLHDRRLDHRDQRHVGVGRNGDGAEELRGELGGQVDGRGAVRAADDADGGGLRAGEAQEVRAEEGEEHAELGSRKPPSLRMVP